VESAARIAEAEAAVRAALAEIGEPAVLVCRFENHGAAVSWRARSGGMQEPARSA
jgi:hypothetical protein